MQKNPERQEVTTNTVTANIDISSYTSSNPYYTPSVGYIWVRNISGQTGKLVAYGSTIPIGGAQGDFALYVKKGCRVHADGTSYYMYFRSFS